MKRTMKATGGKIQTSITNFQPEMLGTCGVFEEKVFGAERFNLFK
jgi:T-complex protein 1 subunit eta